MTVVEIKRRSEIGTEIVDEVEAKARKLRRLTNASIRTALVYCGKLSPAVEAEGFFDFVVPVEKLMGL